MSDETAPLDAEGYRYPFSKAAHTAAYLLPAVRRALARLPWKEGARRVLDLGCGNGSIAAELTQDGYTVIGIDPSREGVRVANAAHPGLRIEVGSCYDNLAEKYGTFPTLVSLEVIEHVFLPKEFARTVASLLEPGGTAIISTPYHGYWKNLALAVTGKMDSHFTALWDYGHIKFWSVRTLTRLLEEVGLQVDQFVRVGRIPFLAKSMIAIARRPE